MGDEQVVAAARVGAVAVADREHVAPRATDDEVARAIGIEEQKATVARVDHRGVRGQIVTPRVPVQPVGPGAADEHVVPVAARQSIVRLTAAEVVAPATTVEQVATAAAGQAVDAVVPAQLVVPGTAFEGFHVAQRVTFARRVGRPGRCQVDPHRRGRVREGHGVAPVATVDRVGARTGMQPVVACASRQPVGAVAAVEHVVGGPAVEHVVALAAA